VKWAAARTTCSVHNIDPSETSKIRRTPKSVLVKIDDRTLLAVFTDGSVKCAASEWLAYGGWGLHVAEDAQCNVYGHLIGSPVTSYRAETRAMYEAIVRAGETICVICDNAAVVSQMQKILCNRGEFQSWRNDDECADFWDAIAKIIRTCPFQHEARWMPSHLDDPAKAKQLEEFIHRGGDHRWVSGNVAADVWADKGAALAAPPEHPMLRERFKVLLTRTVQRMMIHGPRIVPTLKLRLKTRTRLGMRTLLMG